MPRPQHGGPARAGTAGRAARRAVGLATACAAILGAATPVRAAPATGPSGSTDPAPQASPAAHAATPSTGPAAAADATPAAEPEPAPGEPTPAAEPEPSPAEPTTDPAPAEGNPATTDEQAPPTDDASATTASDRDGGEALPPLTPLQRAGWWTLFGGFAIGSTAGVFSGLAERQEDRATRLANQFSLESASQPVYADVQDEYERYLRRGRAFSRAAIGLAAVTGAAAIAGITIFALEATRHRKGEPRRRARARAGVGALEVRF